MAYYKVFNLTTGKTRENFIGHPNLKSIKCKSSEIFVIHFLILFMTIIQKFFIENYNQTKCPNGMIKVTNHFKANKKEN
jgi:hypothetical protein